MEERYNFFDQFNGFGAWLRAGNILPASAILLYYALLQISNAAGQRRSFTTPNSVIKAHTNLSHQTIQRVREDLKKYDLIDFEVANGVATRYKINPIQTPNPVQNGQGSAPNPVQNGQGSAPNPVQNGQGSAPNPVQNGHIIRKKILDINNKRKKILLEDSQKEAFAVFENQIHPISSISEKENVISLIEEFGANYFIEATKEARKRNARTLNYIAAILRNWQRGGFHGNQRANNGVSRIQLSDDISEAVERKRQRILREILPQYARGDSGKASDMP